MQPNANDPYGFILNNPAKPPSTPLSMGKRIMVVAGGVVLLIIVAVIASAILTSGSKAQTQRYVELAQRQTEIIRLTTIATKKSKSTNTKAYAVTTRIGLESSQRNTSAILAKRGMEDKAISKILGGAKNTKSDTALEEAGKNNRFDETFMELLDGELTNYQKMLNDVSGGASQSEKKTIDTAAKQVTVLRKKSELPITPSSAPASATPDEDSADTGDDLGSEDINIEPTTLDED